MTEGQRPAAAQTRATDALRADPSAFRAVRRTLRPLMRRPPSGAVTLVFTDVDGSTRLLEHLGPEAYVRALEAHRRLLRESFAAHGGVEAEMQGDSSTSRFASARDAVAAATAQRALAAHAWEAERVRLRIGVHTGEPIPDASRGYPLAAEGRIMRRRVRMRRKLFKYKLRTALALERKVQTMFRMVAREMALRARGQALAHRAQTARRRYPLHAAAVLV